MRKAKEVVKEAKEVVEEPIKEEVKEVVKEKIDLLAQGVFPAYEPELADEVAALKEVAADLAGKVELFRTQSTDILAAYSDLSGRVISWDGTNANVACEMRLMAEEAADKLGKLINIV